MAPNIITESDNGAVGDLRMRQQLRLDLQCANLVAAGFDDVGRSPAEDFVVAVVVDGDIARLEPTVLGELLVVRFRSVPVALEHTRTSDQKLTTDTSLASIERK